MSSFSTYAVAFLAVGSFLLSCDSYQPDPINRRTASGSELGGPEQKQVAEPQPETLKKSDPSAPSDASSENPEPDNGIVDIDAGLPPLDLQGPIGGSRPVSVKTPLGFKAQGVKYPLIILLHGFNSDAEGQDRYLGLSRIALDRGYIFIAPNGTPAVSTGAAPGLTSRFWNATESCCNFTNAKVDDVAYIRDLIRQMIARYPVDPKRVYLFGHSNGAFMAHRMACDESLRITAIAALAGSLRPQVSDCRPKVPVAVLSIHGTADPVIQYQGGQTFPTTPRYPSAAETVGHWAKVNGCSATSVNGEKFTVLRESSRLETTPTVYGSCAKNSAAELWTIDQGGHVPRFNEQFIPKVLDFFNKYQR
jgi:polyhydroxybutyrate depolymerase